MGVNDLAIIYQSKLYKIKGKIDALNTVGIKGQKYLNQIEKIDREVNEQIDNYNQDITDKKIYLRDLNIIYNNAIAKLEVLESELEKYNSYIAGYHYCEYLDSKINGEHISEQELNEYVNKIIEFINAINDTDTRDYKEEKEIVERIYLVAYQVMKLEFITLGKSQIFDIAKNNPVIEAFISNKISEDIRTLKENNKITPLINQSISRIQSNGINYSYLDKILITSLALEDDNTIINKIKSNLEELLTKMKDNTSEMENLSREILSNENKISDYKAEIHENNNHNTKEIIKRTVAGLVAGALLYGSYIGGRLTSKVEKYKTTKETYSSLTGYSTEEEYEDKVSDDYKSTNLYVYEPYEKEQRSNYYHRNYTEYDISNICEDCHSLEDYLNLNLEHAASKSEKAENKKASDMTEEDFYDELIYEVVKKIQDPDDFSVEYNLGTWIVFSLFLLIASGTFYTFAIYSMYYNGTFEEIRKGSYEKGKLRDNLIEIKNKLEAFRRLSDNNKEVKEEFARIFENYKTLLETSDFISKIKENESVLIEDPQIELNKRTKRLLKSKIKK